MNWKDELALLNDEQLERIAFAGSSSWGYSYWNYNSKHGYPCCILGHIFHNEQFIIRNYERQNHRMNLGGYSPLELHYLSATDYQGIKNMAIIEEIQNHAKHLLEERKARIEKVILCDGELCGDGRT